MESLGINIKQARENLGMSQKTLAGLLGVQTQTVWRWEKGEREPSWEVLQKIADLLKVPKLLNIFSDDDSSSFSLSYWGSVVDSARNVAIRGDKYEMAEAAQMLKKAFNLVSKEVL